MCSINHDKKAIYIHIPKNGGTYICDILSKYYNFTNYYLQRDDHKSFCLSKDKSVKMHENKLHGTLIYYKTNNDINKKMNMDKNKWNTYTIFTFSRNPYDRAVSGWNYINKYNIPFDKFLNIKQINDFDYWHVFMSQTRHITDIDGKIRCNYIGKFENLEKDLENILFNIGFKNIIHIPFIKNNKKHDAYNTYYENKDTINNINHFFEYDFKNFNYSFMNNIDNSKAI